MYEVITDITTQSGSGKVAVMYFSEESAPLAAVSAVKNFWTAVAAQIVNPTTFAPRGNGRIVDEATGTLTGFYSVATPAAAIGAVTGQQAVPDAAQALVQWRTGVVVAGREVRGRTFIPGLQTPRLLNGNLDTTARSAFNTAAADNLLPLSIGFGIWSRPKAGRPGQHIQATAATTWAELAVLRRRR